MNRTVFSAASEFVGVFFLTLAALTIQAPLTAVGVGLVLLVFVYVIGSISGCHLNPAITAGLVVTRQFPLMEGLIYVLAQVAGAMVAKSVVLNGWIGSWGSYRSGNVVGEVVGAGILMLAVAAVTEKRVTAAGSGVAVGPALLVGLMLSGGLLNPAIAIAMGLWLSPAVWASTLGAVAFASLYVLLKRGTPPKVA